MTEVVGVHKIEIAQYYLECTEGSSNKFYRIVTVANKTTDKASMLIQYGPIGRTGSGSTTHGLTIQDIYNQASKKLNEKEKKGYLSKISKSSMKTGQPGDLTAHTFGLDKLKDKEVLSIMRRSFGSTFVETTMTTDGWKEMTEPSEADINETKEKINRMAEIEKERTSTYQSTWGAWA